MTRFRYTLLNNQPGSLMPRLPLTLHGAIQSLIIRGLVDSGSTVNVLPYAVGLALGAVWEEQLTRVTLTGNLGRYEARSLFLRASHPNITGNDAVRLVFAWSLAPDAPILFGQMNFFELFNVYFFRSEGVFEVALKDNP